MEVRLLQVWLGWVSLFKAIYIFVGSLKGWPFFQKDSSGTI